MSVALLAGSSRAAGVMLRSFLRRDSKAWLVGARMVQAVLPLSAPATPEA